MLKKAELYFEIDSTTFMKMTIAETANGFSVTEICYDDLGAIKTENEKNMNGDKEVLAHISSRMLRIAR